MQVPSAAALSCHPYCPTESLFRFKLLGKRPPVRRIFPSGPRSSVAASSRVRLQSGTAAAKHHCTGASTSSQFPVRQEERNGAASQVDGAPSCSGRPASASGSADRHSLHSATPDRMVAAMALSPLAALSLPLIQDGAWKQSLADFSLRVRGGVRGVVDQEGVQQAAAAVDEGFNFMEWTWQWTGVDLTYIWDAELWLRFKEAIWQDDPNIFWNKLLDRIQYKDVLPGAGLVGDMRISYSKFLSMLEAHRVKRVVVYGDLKTAVVEVPHPWYSSIVGAPGVYPFLEDNDFQPLSLLQPNPLAPDDPTQWFCPEMPEWNMEKYRFYVDLPGDFWESGVLLRYLRSREVGVEWDAASGQYVRPYAGINKVFEVRTELQLLDPSESWDFLGWLTESGRMEFYEKAAAVCIFVRLISVCLNLATGTRIFRTWAAKKDKKDKSESAWERLTSSRAREFMTKDSKTGKSKDTGVRFSDIAGLDHIVLEMKEVVKMLLKDPAYVKVGAKCPRGIIFQGPPGTGKTYLARAIAGEAGVTFYSAVGSEFVEMFAGVASARVNSLFYNARKKSPCIIFIDEIDAIGRARSALGSDPGSMERESALLAMLVQMDGIHGNTEQVLTIGATNLASELDQALLRPGRFEVVYEIPSPGPVARLEILKYHSKGKPLSGEGMLQRVAEVTQGWSAASLANLMNEAAILTVRRSTDKITLPMVLEIVEGNNWGGRAGKLPPGEAKNRLAMVTAAKAVAFALTPGLDVIKRVTLWSQKRGLGPQVEFLISEENLGLDWHPEEVEIMDFKTNFKVNAASVGDEKLGEFFHVASLLQPLYAPRAAELAFFGKDGASLATAPLIADCFDIAYYCVRNSLVHPRFKSLPPLHTYIWLGENAQRSDQRDPLAVGLEQELGYHQLTLTLLKASWRRAQKLVAERRSAIVAVAEALLAAPDETITGTHLVELIERTQLDDSSHIVIDSQFLAILKEVLGSSPPTVVLQGEAAATDLQETSSSRTGDSSSGRDLEELGRASSAVGCAGYSGAGAAGQASFSRQKHMLPSQARHDSTATSGSSSFHSTHGCVGQATFARSAAAAALPEAPPMPPLQLDETTLLSVSRAIMGRTDIVDLVGRNTAYEMAERVRDALTDPSTVDRLTAIRRYVEDRKGDVPFPPAPAWANVPQPADGGVGKDLEWWKQRQINVITWSAAEMLFTPRQMQYYANDMDYPGAAEAREQQQLATAERTGTAAPTRSQQ